MVRAAPPQLLFVQLLLVGRHMPLLFLCQSLSLCPAGLTQQASCFSALPLSAAYTILHCDYFVLHVFTPLVCPLTLFSLSLLPV